MNVMRFLKGLSYLVAALLFFWFVLMKVASRLVARLGWSGLCPASVSFLVNNPVRRRYMRPVLDWAGIRPGERVLELGPGPGVFTIEAARRAGPAGRLIAVDIQPKMIAQVRQRVAASGLTNVEAYVAGAERLPIPDNSVDLALLISVLPEIQDRPAALAELCRVVRPGGILSITAEFTDPDYLFARETVRLLEAHGFKPAAMYGSWWRYTANFRLVVGLPVSPRYTVADEPALLRDYDGGVGKIRPLLVKRYGEPFVGEIAADAREEFRRLIPQLPYIGGKANRLTFDLLSTAWFLALYRALQRQGKEIDEVGPLLRDVYQAWLDSFPAWLLRLRGWWAFTPPARRRLARQGQWSQQRMYPGNWVFTVNGENGYDLGVDYSECGILKFCREQNATELMPYLCSVDFIMSERAHVGLKRTTTLGEGYERCDFRFKEGGATIWPAGLREEVFGG